MADKNQLYRILDANLNRTKEGLRVCEDISRYIWDQKALTKALKNLRHQLTLAMAKINMLKALENRCVEGDVGRGSILSELKRTDVSSVFLANAGRVKESLRVLEEISKLLNTNVSQNLKSLRYRFYVLEQKAFKRS